MCFIFFASSLLLSSSSSFSIVCIISDIVPLSFAQWPLYKMEPGYLAASFCQ